VEILVRVVPKSAKTGIAGYLPDGSWKIKIAAAPDKGKANRELCEFLAAHFGVASGRVTIVSGQTSRIKRVRIEE
jgi:uncharacterized protein (TIGR00251 family)